MLSHLSLGVADLDRSIRFYDATLATLGCTRVWTTETGCGYGEAGGNDRLALFAKGTAASPPGAGFHLALAAADRDAVAAFHRAALASGGECCGPPGLRPRYGPAYFAAFVTDPDGHKLEAVHQ